MYESVIINCVETISTLFARSIVKIRSNSPIFATDKNVNSITKNLFIMKKRLFLLTMCFMSVSYVCSQTTMQEYTFADEDYGESPHHTLLERRFLNDFKTSKGTVYIIEYLRKNKTLSCYAIQYRSNNEKIYYHLGIPSHMSDKLVLSKYKKKIETIPNEIKGLFLYYIVFYLGFES